jgi:hypothetical protein
MATTTNKEKDDSNGKNKKGTNPKPVNTRTHYT